MHNLLFSYIHLQSGSIATFEFLHFPEWRSICLREIGSLHCTVLHTVSVSAWRERAESGIKYFLAKKKWEMDQYSSVSCTVQKDMKELVVLCMPLTTNPWRLFTQVFELCVKKSIQCCVPNPYDFEVLRTQCIEYWNSIQYLCLLDLWACCSSTLLSHMQRTKEMVELLKAANKCNKLWIVI